jgi:hypothetical protein
MYDNTLSLTYELELGRNFPKNQSTTSRRHDLRPFSGMSRINVSNVFLYPFDPPRLGISIVHNVVDMSLFSSLADLYSDVQRWPTEV